MVICFNNSESHDDVVAVTNERECLLGNKSPRFSLIKNPKSLCDAWFLLKRLTCILLASAIEAGKCLIWQNQ